MDKTKRGAKSESNRFSLFEICSRLDLDPSWDMKKPRPGRVRASKLEDNDVFRIVPS